RLGGVREGTPVRLIAPEDIGAETVPEQRALPGALLVDVPPEAVPAPGVYDVRLFLGNGFGGTSAPGQRVFDVAIEGSVLASLDDIDLAADFGHQVGAMISNQVTVTDGQLNIEFLHGVENPLINAIEIVQLVGVDVDPTVSILSGDQTVGEGDGQVQISIATDVTVPADETVLVDIEITPGSATPGTDYDYASPSATFDPETGVYTDTVTIAGSSSDVTVLIDILQDTIQNEGSEAFSIAITGVSDNAATGTATAGVTIQDDDTVIVPGQVLFRINSGGEQVASNDAGPDWSADTDTAPTPFLVAGGENTFAGDAAITIDPADVNGVPAAIFDAERL
ncbi:MAG: malectin domain-containing carbohydrate-binding protein, partial [Pseudomonadota bacterium]